MQYSSGSGVGVELVRSGSFTFDGGVDGGGKAEMSVVVGGTWVSGYAEDQVVLDLDLPVGYSLLSVRQRCVMNVQSNYASNEEFDASGISREDDAANSGGIVMEVNGTAQLRFTRPALLALRTDRSFKVVWSIVVYRG